MTRKLAVIQASERTGTQGRPMPGKKMSRLPTVSVRRRSGVKKSNVANFHNYIFKVLKQVHPDLGSSKKTISIMNSLVVDMAERVVGEAVRLAQYNNKTRLTAREIQTSARLTFPGELSKHAVAEGTKALTKFVTSKEAEKLTKMRQAPPPELQKQESQKSEPQ